MPKLVRLSSSISWRKHQVVDYFAQVVESRVYDILSETLCHRADSLSRAVNNTVFLKREDCQPTFSFNVRGSYNKISQSFDPQLHSGGVVSSDAGNHAVGVAYSASKLQLDALLVVPKGTCRKRIKHIEQYGARVMEHGHDTHEAMLKASQLSLEQSRLFVHHDDPLVLAGHGTVAMEIVKQMREIDYLFCPVGAGDLIAGLQAFTASVAPHIRIVGVEIVGENVLAQSLIATRPVTLTTVNRFTDSATTVKNTMGTEALRICMEAPLHATMTVSTDEICAAIKDTFGDTRALLEPFGAMSVAGMKKFVATHQLKKTQLVCILASANMDFKRLRFVSERSDDRERFMALTLPETSGSFQTIYESFIYPRNVTEFSYRMHSEADQTAQVVMSIQTTTLDEFHTIMDAINASTDFSAIDLTSNEMAKSHLRHLVGGRAAVPISNERIFRMEFPETPGALKDFLSVLGQNSIGWNVSLFHYRNHGADIGRVLVGFQLPESDSTAFQRKLDLLGFNMIEETANPIYNSYLK